MRQLELALRRAQNVDAFAWLLYGGALTGLLFFYHFVSDGDFSFLLTLAGIVRFLGFAMLLFHLVKDKTAAGVSAKSLSLFAAAFISRFLCVWNFQGYLPLDRTGDYVPHVELLSFFVAAGTLGVVLHTHRATYAREEDSFGKNVVPGVPHEFGGVYLLVPALVLAIIFHPSLNNHFVSDTLWTFALYLEAVAPIPQLIMFQRSQKPIERWTSHFVFSLSLARVLSLLFWVSSYHELNSTKTITGRWVGILALLNECLAVLVLLDYAYLYVTAMRSGHDVNLMTTV